MKLENLARANELDFLIKEAKNKLEVFVTLKKYYNIAVVFNKDLTLADRVWTCECGAVINRDENAAINIMNVGLSMV